MVGQDMHGIDGRKIMLYGEGAATQREGFSGKRSHL
jgi:hypothetical protein